MAKTMIDDSTLRVRELLVVIEYLLSKTDDKHFSCQQDIIRFAKEHYDLDIRRQRVGKILEGLYSYPEITSKLGFVVDAIDAGRITHYYVSERLLSPSQLVDIDKALKKDKSNISDVGDDKIITKLSYLYLSDYQKDNVEKILNRTKSIHKLKSFHKRMFNELWDAKLNRLEVNLYMYELEPGIEGIIDGYIYDIIEFNGDYLIYLIRKLNHDLVSVELKKIRKYSIAKHRDNDIKNLNEIYQSDKYKTIEDEINSSVIISNHDEIEIEFDFYRRHIIDSFKERFNKDLPYTISSDHFKIYNNGFKENKYFHAKFKMGLSMIIEWISDYKILNYIDNLKPIELTRLLAIQYRNLYNRMGRQYQKLKQELDK